MKKAHFQTQKLTLLSIAYYPVSERFVAKAKREDGSTFYSFFDFDKAKHKFVNVDEHMYTKDEVIEKFNEILKMPENSPDNAGSEDVDLWVVWGSLMSK